MVAFYRQSVYFIGNCVLSYFKSPLLSTLSIIFMVSYYARNEGQCLLEDLW